MWQLQKLREESWDYSIFNILSVKRKETKGILRQNSFFELTFASVAASWCLTPTTEHLLLPFFYRELLKSATRWQHVSSNDNIFGLAIVMQSHRRVMDMMNTFIQHIHTGSTTFNIKRNMFVFDVNLLQYSVVYCHSI